MLVQENERQHFTTTRPQQESPGRYFHCTENALTWKNKSVWYLTQAVQQSFPGDRRPWADCSGQSRQAHITHADVDTVWLIYSTAPDQFTLLSLCYCLFKLISDHTIRTQSHIPSADTHVPKYTHRKKLKDPLQLTS